jgi:uncharacterized protein YjbI with pentapeptide repeats
MQVGNLRLAGGLMTRQVDPRARTVRFGWPLVLAGLAIALLAACVFVFPALIVPGHGRVLDEVPVLDRLRLDQERMALRNQVRTTLLQAFGGTFFLATALLTWRQIQVSKQGQVTERFTRAIEHLGTGDKIDVRLGGIYALEQIARDSSTEHGAIVEILTAYVRGHAARDGPEQQPGEPPPLRQRAMDVQAALTVLGRREVAPGDAPVLELGGLDLRNAALPDANLSAARLAGTDLSGTDLRRADLQGADLPAALLIGSDLRRATLRGARMPNADLRKARLAEADLEGADLHAANLREAELVSGRLSRADLRGANLGQADLRGAQLRGARLDDANLWSARLAGADIRGASLIGTTMVQVDLGGAGADGGTVWPHGFDWRQAGVVLDER